MKWDRRGDPVFHWRGGEVSRLEGFSDAVFGFALTLLVVTQQVPHSYDDLMTAMGGFLPFAVCFVLLLSVWRRHYRYFRRFALEDSTTVALNGLLLFVVVFYVYPLKFLFTLVSASMGIGEKPGIETADQVRVLFTIYGLGFAAIFVLYALLYHHVWRRREDLQLDELERFGVRGEINASLGNAAVGLTSIGFALIVPGNLVGWSGFVYFACAIVETWHGAYVGDHVRKLRTAETAPPRPAPKKKRRKR